MLIKLFAINALLAVTPSNCVAGSSLRSRGLNGIFNSATVQQASQVWQVPSSLHPTIQDAIYDATNVTDGDTIEIANGNFKGAILNRSLHFVGSGSTVIDDGPPFGGKHKVGFQLIAGADGSSFSKLTFDNNDPNTYTNPRLHIYSRDLVTPDQGIDDITIEQCTFLNANQAVSNWGGDMWYVANNKIINLYTSCGGGIGILLADRGNGTVIDNLVEHNDITGTLFVDPDDCGGYAGSGIVLYSDRRWSFEGTQSIHNNFITRNSVSLVSDNSTLVDVWAFEMTDAFDGSETPYDDERISDNAVTHNNWKGTDNQVKFEPEDLEDANTLSRNKGAKSTKSAKSTKANRNL